MDAGLRLLLPCMRSSGREAHQRRAGSRHTTPRRLSSSPSSSSSLSSSSFPSACLMDVTGCWRCKIHVLRQLSAAGLQVNGRKQGSALGANAGVLKKTLKISKTVASPGFYSDQLFLYCAFNVFLQYVWPSRWVFFLETWGELIRKLVNDSLSYAMWKICDPAKSNQMHLKSQLCECFVTG